MKKIILLKKALAVAFAMFTCHSALAYDFYKDGIYYNIISKDDRTVEVARSEGGLFGNYSEAEYTIPSKVIYAKTTYTVIAIEEYAFSDCSSLASIDIPSSVTTIGEHAFSNCIRLTSVDMTGSSVTTIGDGAFYACSSLTSIDLPGSLTTIWKRAFAYCSSLALIDLPSSLTTIDEEAFYGCSSLVSVYCRATTPPSAEYDIFPDETLQGTLYVPIGTKADYEAVDPWRNFWTIEETDFSTGVNNALRDDGITVVANGNSIVVIGDNAGRIEVYCVNGQCVYSGTDTVIDNLAKGVYVVKVDNKTFKVLL